MGRRLSLNLLWLKKMQKIFISLHQFHNFLSEYSPGENLKTLKQQNKILWRLHALIFSYSQINIWLVAEAASDFLTKDTNFTFHEIAFLKETLKSHELIIVKP